MVNVPVVSAAILATLLCSVGSETTSAGTMMAVTTSATFYETNATTYENTVEPTDGIHYNTTTIGSMQSTDGLTTTQANSHMGKGDTSLCSDSLHKYTLVDGGLLAKYGQNCYEVVPLKASWSHAEFNCKKKGGHLLHIASAVEQEFIYNFLLVNFNHSIWTGLHDRNNEEQFEWISGDPVTYLNWAPGRKDMIFHSIQDCALLVPSLQGEWDDVDCGADSAILERFEEVHSFICQFHTADSTNSPASSTASSATIDGNINMCSSVVQHHAELSGGILGQMNNSCYELLPQYKYSWRHGESICMKRGGHLVHISSADEQAFIENFMNRHLPRNAVWIGLHDSTTEGVFEWTSGDAVQYTNWVSGHTDHFVSHDQEDCVVFVPYQNGQWDDIPCGDSLTFAGDIGETHPIICQYGIKESNNAGVIVGR